MSRTALQGSRLGNSGAALVCHAELRVREISVAEAAAAFAYQCARRAAQVPRRLHLESGGRGGRRRRGRCPGPAAPVAGVGADETEAAEEGREAPRARRAGDGRGGAGDGRGGAGDGRGGAAAAADLAVADARPRGVDGRIHGRARAPPGRTNIFNATSTYVYSHGFDVRLSLSEKNSPRANDSSKNQPKRRRFDRERAV